MEAIRLHTEASKFEAIKKSLQDEVTRLEASAVGKDRVLTDLNAQLTFAKSHNDNLVHELEISSFRLQEKVAMYEDYMSRLEKFQDDRMKEVNDKFDKLYTDFIEMALHLEEKFYPHLLTAISGRRWLLTHGMKLAITICLNLTEYLSALGAAVGKAIEKGMQDGLSAGITHGKKGRVLADIVAYNPSAKVDYISTLQQLQSVNFSLLAKLKSNMDASVETLMNVLLLEEALAERLGLNELQPHVDQLIVPIHHSPDKVVVGATALSRALDVSSAKGNSDTVPYTVSTTTTLSITFASASLIAPISIDDYEVVGTDDQMDINGNAAPFPNVDDAELNIPHCFPSWSLNLYAPFPSASVTSYGPSHLGPSFPVSFARLASLLLYTRSTSAVLSVGMPISIRMTASVPYVNENGVSPLLDFIMVWCAHRTCEISSNQFLFFSPNLAFIPSLRLRFALSTRPLNGYGDVIGVSFAVDSLEQVYELDILGTLLSVSLRPYAW
ncbi:hypothetical protein Tco_1386953 [Tanacetum coccineum]